MGLRTQLETHDSALVFGGQVKHTLVGKLHMPEDCIAYCDILGFIRRSRLPMNIPNRASSLEYVTIYNEITYIVLHPPMKMFYPFIIMNTLGFSVLSDAIRYTLWDCILWIILWTRPSIKEFTRVIIRNHVCTIHNTQSKPRIALLLVTPL